jgi:hypothetical protein
MGGFSLRGLSVLAYANGFALWHYRADSVRDALDPRFFDAAKDMLAPGDVILISATDGARQVCVAQNCVTLPVVPMQ